MDENLHHNDGENPGVVAEKVKLRSFTEREMVEMVDQHLRSWHPKRGDWLRNLLNRFDFRRRHYMHLIVRDNDGGKSFNLNIRLGISSRTSIHSKLVMLTAKWLVDSFIQNVSRHDPRTLELINSLPFIMITREADNGDS